MRIHDRFKSTMETSAKPSRFDRFKDAAREKNYYARNILVGTALATTAINMLSADAAEKQQVPQAPETSTAIDSPTPVDTIETMTVAESGPSLRVTFPDMNTNFDVTPPESTQFDSFLQNVGTYIQNDPSAVVIFSINGSASDEDRSSSINGDSNLGLPSASNEQLAYDYATTTYQQLSESVARTSGNEAFRVGDVSSQEALLAQVDQSAIEKIATEKGLSRYALLGAYNDQTIQLDGADALTLTTLIDDNRGATITTSIERSSTPLTEQLPETAPIPTEQDEVQPISETPHRFMFVPFAVPLRLRRRKNTENTSVALTNEPVESYVQMLTPVTQEYNSAASAIPATENYNHQLSPISAVTSEYKPRLAERMPPTLRRMTRPIRHQVSYAISEFERKKSGREMDRSNKASMKRAYLQLREKPSLRRIVRDFKHDVIHAFRSRI